MGDPAHRNSRFGLALVFQLPIAAKIAIRHRNGHVLVAEHHATIGFLQCFAECVADAGPFQGGKARVALDLFLSHARSGSPETDHRLADRLVAVLGLYPLEYTLIQVVDRTARQIVGKPLIQFFVYAEDPELFGQCPQEQRVGHQFVRHHAGEQRSGEFLLEAAEVGREDLLRVPPVQRGDRDALPWRFPPQALEHFTLKTGGHHVDARWQHPGKPPQVALAGQVGQAVEHNNEAAALQLGPGAGAGQPQGKCLEQLLGFAGNLVGCSCRSLDELHQPPDHRDWIGSVRGGAQIMRMHDSVREAILDPRQPVRDQRALAAARFALDQDVLVAVGERSVERCDQGLAAQVQSPSRHRVGLVPQRLALERIRHLVGRVGLVDGLPQVSFQSLRQRLGVGVILDHREAARADAVFQLGDPPCVILRRRYVVASLRLRPRR